MDKDLDMEMFGRIMNEVIEENEVKMLITLPTGMQDATVESNIGIGAIEFFILLDAIPAVFGKMLDDLGKFLDMGKSDQLIDEMLDMVRDAMRETTEKHKRGEM